MKINRWKINNKLYPLTRVFHDQIPLDKVQSILEDFDIVLLQEDNTKWSGFLCGRDSNTIFALGLKSSVNDHGVYEQIDNYLYFSWYRHDTTDKYEINMYLC